MEYLSRQLTDNVLEMLQPNKVIIISGARRVGKTVMVNEVLSKIKEPKLVLNGEDISVHDQMAVRSIENYRKLLGDHRLLYIDEAQKIPDIGLKLKLMVDNIEGLKVIISGSSALDIHQNAGEPLTGRKYSLNLHALSEKEFNQIEDQVVKKEKLQERLIFGNYPELVHLNTSKKKAIYLNEIISSYLLKDILIYENLKSSQKIFNLLKLIAFQVGSEVSIQELGKQLGISKNTVEKYLDLLCKVYIIHRISGYSRNLRKEITKNARWYFLDNGIRNAVIANFQPLASRNDVGQLWENYMISERIKHQEYAQMSANNYFWRTYDQQEIDWVEERDGGLFGYEMKWQPRKVKVPPQWKKAYPEANFEVISQENYLPWIS